MDNIIIYISGIFDNHGEMLRIVSKIINHFRNALTRQE